MYGEEFIRNEYDSGRKRWFEKRHPALCGNATEWRRWQMYERLRQNSCEMLEALGYIQPTPQPEPVVIQ